MDLYLKCENFIKEKGIIKEGDNILAAVSGGPDSIFLLHFLMYLKNKHSFSLKVAFIHHHLRKQSDREFLFVKDLSKKFKLPFYYRNIKIEGKKGIEQQAREKRYRALYQIAKKTDCNKIATGHTLNDNVETVLLNLFRGTGLAGISGILPEREIFKNSKIYLIRPILDVSKKEIENFLNEKKIKYFIDKSNKNLKYRRNLIRHKIIPYIENYFPHFSKIVAKTSFIIQDDFIFIKNSSEKALNSVLKNGKFNVEEFKNYDISIRRFIIHLLIQEFTGEIYRSFHKIEKLRKSIEKRREKEIPLSVIEKKIKGEKKEKKIYREIKVPGEEKIEDIVIRSEYVKFSPSILKNKDKYTGYFNGEKTGEKIIVRTVKKGDRFHPLGMKEEKKLSRFFIDKKIPSFLRDKILIFQSENEIMWVCGIEISEKFKVSKNTKKILKITVRKGGENA